MNKSRRPFSLFRFFIALTLLGVVLTHSQTSWSAFFDPKLHWKTVKTPHFNIHFHDGEEEIALRMADIAEKVYTKLSPEIRWKPWGRTEVVLTDTTDISNAFATTLPYNYLLLYISSPEGTSSLSYYDNWLEELFTHEFTHILHIDKYGGIAKPFRWVFGKIVTPNGLTPGWVREGIAVYEESKGGRGRNHSSFSDMMLRTDILNHEFIAIDEAAGSMIEWPSAFAPYIYGGEFWQYLADTYGDDKIMEFIQRYGDSVWVFSLNNKARKTFGDRKHFVKLWREWKESLEKKYGQVKEELTAKGLTNLETLVHIKGNLFAPTLSPDGKKLIYAKTDLDKSPEIRMFDLGTKEDIRLVKGRSTNQISFSPDGQKIAFGSMGTYKFFYSYNELFEVDLASKKLSSLTSGKRASDPDYSPDGKSIVFVENKLGSTQLYLYDRESRKERPLTQAPAFTRFSNPRFSPDGKLIAVSAWMNGNRDIYLYDLDGKIVTQLTHDAAVDNEPRWGQDGKYVYYTSDKSGISNIYRQSASSGPAEMITNVLTGVFHPQVIPGSNKVTAQRYFGRGYDIVAFEETPPKAPLVEKGKREVGYRMKKVVRHGKVRWVKVKTKEASDLSLEKGDAAGGKGLASASETPAASTTGSEPAMEYKIEKYNPFKKVFVPRFLMPGFLYGPGTAIFSLRTGSSDPLGRHIWTGDVYFRTDANFVGGDFLYTYNRWYTPFYLGFDDYLLNYGDLFRIGKTFFEEHKRVYAGVRVPYGRHKLDLFYAYERVSDDSNLPAAFDPFLNFGNYGGFNLRYTFTRVNKFPASISLEGGPRLSLSLEINDHVLGSGERNETKIVEGDIREYIRVPGTKHHVFALRASGGYNFGDKLFQGVFRLGSALGEGFLSERTPHLYPLRGLPQITFAGDGALLFSGEYRMPLYMVDRGITTAPIFLRQLHLALFADYGTVFNTSPKLSEFLLGVGGELRGDFVIGYGLPITARLGYGVIVKGREFLGNLTDPITKSSIKNGTLILQLGTSF